MTITESKTNAAQAESTSIEILEQVFTDNDDRLWSGEDEYLFAAGYSTLDSVELLEDNTLLVLEQDPVARREFLRDFADIYDTANPYEYIRWGKAFNWQFQEFNGEVSVLYVEEWALEYVVAALRNMASNVLAGKYAPRRAVR